MVEGQSKKSWPTLEIEKTTDYIKPLERSMYEFEVLICSVHQFIVVLEL